MLLSLHPGWESGGQGREFWLAGQQTRMHAGRLPGRGSSLADLKELDIQSGGRELLAKESHKQAAGDRKHVSLFGMQHTYSWVWLSLRGIESGTGQIPAAGRREQPTLAGKCFITDIV